MKGANIYRAFAHLFLALLILALDAGCNRDVDQEKTKPDPAMTLPRANQGKEIEPVSESAKTDLNDLEPNPKKDVNNGGDLPQDSQLAIEDPEHGNGEETTKTKKITTLGPLTNAIFRSKGVPAPDFDTFSPPGPANFPVLLPCVPQFGL